MKERIITGILLTGLAVVLLWMPGVIMATVSFVFMAFAAWEEFHALKTAGHRTVSWPTWMCYALSIPLAYLYGKISLIPLMAAALFVTCICVLFRAEPDLVDLSLSVMPLLTILLPGLSFVSMSLLFPHAKEVVYLALTMGVPLVGDMFAMLAGSRIGGPKLCPAVSPNKTVSGSIAGLGGSVLAAMLVWIVTLITCNPETLAILPRWWHYPLLGLLGGYVGQIGDLFASLIKRHSGIKDFSNLFPGHGGMLDRLDSTLFMAVLMYCYMLLLA